MSIGRQSPFYALPVEDVPAALAGCAADGDPLADDGDAILVLIEAGAGTRAAPLLDAAVRAAMASGRPELTVLCHLLKAFGKGRAGEKEPARRWLEKALAVPIEGGLDAGLKRLQSRVGVEVSLLLDEPADLDVFLRDLEAACADEARERLRGAMGLWRAEAALRRGELVEAERRLADVPSPADLRAAGESTWQVLSLQGEVAAARGDGQEAAHLFEQARAAQSAVAARLPEDLRECYLQAPRRRSVTERLLRIREGTQVLRVPGGRAVSATRLLAAFRSILQGIRSLERHGSLAPLLDYALDAMIRQGGARRGMVVLTDLDEVRVERGRHLEGRSLRPEEMQVSRTIALKAAREGRTIVLADATTDEEFSRAGSVVALGIRSAIAIPLVVEGRTLGSIYLDDPQRVGLFAPDTAEAIEVLAGHAALAIAHARLVERVTRDGLTGAYTHGFFQEQLHRAVALARRHGRSCGIVLLDIDNFKQINDTHGHDFGNVVLKAFSDALRSALRETDYVGQPLPDGTDTGDEASHFGRFGGDEFEVLLLETDPAGLEVVGGKIAEAIRALRFEHAGAVVTVTTSAGGACFPAHAGTSEELFRVADEALYQAKRAGRDRFLLSGAVPAKPDAEVVDPEVDSLLLTREGRTALGMLGRLLEQDADLETLLRRTLALMAKATGAERGFLLVPDGSDSRFRLVLGMEDAEADEADRSPVSRAILARVAAARKAVLVEDVLADPELLSRSSVFSLGVKSVLAVPLPLPEGETGVAYLDIRRAAHRFTREDLALLQVFVRRISPVIANARRVWLEGRRSRALEEELRRLRGKE